MIHPGAVRYSWMYTKYRMHLVEETGFEHPVTINTWIEKMKTTAVTHQAIEITCNGKQVATGRLESCLVDMKSRTSYEAFMYRFSGECSG